MREARNGSLMRFRSLAHLRKARDGLVTFSQLLQGEAQGVTAGRKVRLHLGHLHRLLHRHSIFARHIQIPYGLDSDDQRGGIKFLRLANLQQSFFGPTECG